MITLRSLAFDVLFLGWSAVCSFLVPLTLVLPRPAMQGVVNLWGIGTRVLLRFVVGLDWRVEGLDRVPPGPCVLASKHQSAWDTMIFHALLPDPVYVVKKELTHIPFWGWGFYKAGCVVVDRKAGAKALKHVVEGVRVALARGSQVVIFPEGTRTPVDATVDYHPGIAAIYRDAEVPVVPVALNSGLFWGRRSAIIYPGTVVIRFLEPIRPGLDRKAFMALLHDRIEGESTRLIADARAANRHLPPPKAPDSNAPSA